jgi:hypothetical protein
MSDALSTVHQLGTCIWRGPLSETYEHALDASSHRPVEAYRYNFTERQSWHLPRSTHHPLCVVLTQLHSAVLPQLPAVVGTLLLGCAKEYRRAHKIKGKHSIGCKQTAIVIIIIIIYAANSCLAVSSR